MDFFKGLFVAAIAAAPPSEDLAERLGHLNKEFLESLYRNICRSLFEKDKLIFSCLLTLKLLEMGKELDQRELKFFLTGGVSLGEELPAIPCEWMSEKLWGELCRLDKLSSFKGFLDHFMKNHELYKKMYDSSSP